MWSDTYRQNLDSLLQDHNATPAQITAARGRLIVALNRDFNEANDIQTTSRLRNEIRNEMSIHQNQLNARLQNTKQNSRFLGTQVIGEVGLKRRKIANSVRQFRMSERPGEYVANGARVVGNTLSTAFSVAKAPIIATMRLASIAVPVLTSIAVQPLQVPAYLFTKLINPDAKYNGRIITDMGREVGNLVSNGLNLGTEVIRRI